MPVIKIREKASKGEYNPAHLLALPILVLFDGRSLPDFVVILRDVEEVFVLQCVLNHELVVLQLQIL